MIIHNFNVKGMLCAFRPFKTKSPLLVDTDAELPVPVAAERFKVITGQEAQIVLTLGVFQKKIRSTSIVQFSNLGSTDHFDLLSDHQRRAATTAHRASPIPNGHAPCRKP